MVPSNLNSPATAGTPKKALSAGEVAPDFTLRCTPDQAISLSELRGHPVILAFYPGRLEFRSAATRWRSTTRFCRSSRGKMPRCSASLWTASGAMQPSRLTGICIFRCWPTLSQKAKSQSAMGSIARRKALLSALCFVIDGDGIIRWSYVSPVAVNPGADGILTALEALSSTPKTASNVPAESDDTDFCESEGVLCALPRKSWRKSSPRWGEKAMSEHDSAHLTLPVGERDHAQGPANAPVTLVEYGDYECPYCGAAYPIVKGIQRATGRPAALRLPQFPADADPSARRSTPPRRRRPPAAQGKFWEMHDCLFEHQRALERQPSARVRRRGRAGHGASSRGRWRITSTRSARPRGLHERRAQRRQRHADLLHQRRPPR